MADKDDEFEAELKKLESPNFDDSFDDDDDDASSAMGGFPGDTGGFPDEEPASEEQDPFAGGFDDPFEEGFDTPESAPAAEPEDAFSGGEDDFGEPGEPEFEEEPQFDEGDEFDPEAEEQDAEDEVAGDDDGGDYDADADAGNDDDAPAPGGKGNLILYGGLVAMFTLVGGAGYFVVKPMLSGGNAPPPITSPLDQPAPEAFQPGEMAPAEIPQPAQPQAAPVMPGALPPPPGGERIQVPGYPTNVGQENLQPNLNGVPVQLPGNTPGAATGVPSMPSMGRPALPAPVAVQPQPVPTMQPITPGPIAVPTPGPIAGPVGTPALPGSGGDFMNPSQVPDMPSLDLSDEPSDLPSREPAEGAVVPTAPNLPGLPGLPKQVEPVTPAATGAGLPAPLPKAEAETDAVLAKLDAIMSRFADLEEKFVTEDDVSKMIDAAVAKVTISGGGEGFTAVEGTIEALNERVAGLQETLTASPSDEIIAQLEARFEERFAALEAKITSPMKVAEAVEAKTDDTDAKADEAKAEAAKAEEAKKAAKAKADATAKLKATVSRQQAEIVNLKARGGAYTPPSKPTVHTNYRLAGMSSDQAWIETPGGVSRFSVGQQVPGLSIIKEFRQMDGNFVVVMENGIIVP